MSPSRRRTRRKRDHGPAHPAAAAAPAVREDARAPGARRELTEWKWRTFPVYFAFSAGIFLGVYLGALGAWAGTDGNNIFFLIVSIAASILLGFGLSRLVVRVMIRRNWVRPRSRRR